MEMQHRQMVTFQNVWKNTDSEIRDQVISIWKNFSKLPPEKINERMGQFLYVVKNEDNKVVGISTAFKTYIMQLRNHLYVYRCLITPDYSIPGLDAKLTVLSRNFLESIHKQDGPEVAIGLLAMIQNPKLKERTMAKWPASGFVYIGNSREGTHIRVYYFKGARIHP